MPLILVLLPGCSFDYVTCSSADQCQRAFGAQSTCSAAGYCTNVEPGTDTSPSDTSPPTTPTPTGDTGGKTVDPPPNLAVHYEFEGTGVSVSDSSGRGLHASISDLSARTAEGRVGRGVKMSDATPPTQYVEVPSQVLERVDDFTIAVWVKLETIQPWSRIYDLGNGLVDPQNRFMYLTPNGVNGIHAASYGGASNNESTLITGTQLPTGVWKHLALTGHAGDRTLYIDGFPAMDIRDAPDVPPLEMEPLAPQSWLGKSRFPADPGLDGTIDDFRIYGRVLSPTEIADLAFPKTDYAHWRFDGEATDFSGHNIPTVLANGATWTTNGRLGGALDLGGGAAGPFGPHAAMDDNPLAACTDQLTISLWIKLRAFDTGARALDFGTSDDTTFLYLAPTDGTGVHLGMRSPAGDFDLGTKGPLFPADDTWHPIAVTIDSENLVSLYVDGVIANSATSKVSPGDFAKLDELLLGSSRSIDHPYLNGSLDELRIACRAYTADEIENLSRR